MFTINLTGSSVIKLNHYLNSLHKLFRVFSSTTEKHMNGDIQFRYFTNRATNVLAIHNLFLVFR